MAFDLLIDQATNDLDLSGGVLKFTTEVREEVAQRVGIKLRTYAGEWFLDTTYGIPYLQEIIAQARNKRDIDSIFISEIRSEEGVSNIISYDSTFENNTRKYTAKVVISTPEGEISVYAIKDPSQVFQYPAPIEGDPIAKCGLDEDFMLGDKLFEFINFSGLPQTGNSTWNNKWN